MADPQQQYEMDREYIQSLIATQKLPKIDIPPRGWNDIKVWYSPVIPHIIPFFQKIYDVTWSELCEIERVNIVYAIYLNKRFEYDLWKVYYYYYN